MYVIQEGRVEVVVDEDGKEVRLMVLDTGELFGEMSIVERQVRMATVRALGPARVLTIDRKDFLRRIHQDPSLAWRVVQTLSGRVRELDAEVARLKGGK
jgi:CRP-like cAMP-binding protein